VKIVIGNINQAILPSLSREGSGCKQLTPFRKFSLPT
jgi:hypothetical protein